MHMMAHSHQKRAYPMLRLNGKGCLHASGIRCAKLTRSRRLAALEAAVSEIKQYLGLPSQGSILQAHASHAPNPTIMPPENATASKSSNGFVVQPSSTPGGHSNAQSGQWSSVPNEETTSKSAPIQVVRRLNKIIMDDMSPLGQLPDITLSQLENIGFEIDGLGFSLFQGYV
jgi:hypothetical protein